MTCAPFSSEVYRKLKKMHTQFYVKMKLKKNIACACWPWHGYHSQRFLKFPDQLNNNGLNPPLTAIPCLNLFIYAFSKSRAVCIRVFHSIWKYQMKRFIGGTRTFCATGVSVEWHSQKRLGGGGQEASSPGKFLWLDSLKCNFLHSLDHNWLTRKIF